MNPAPPVMTLFTMAPATSARAARAAEGRSAVGGVEHDVVGCEPRPIGSRMLGVQQHQIGVEARRIGRAEHFGAVVQSHGLEEGVEVANLGAVRGRMLRISNAGDSRRSATSGLYATPTTSTRVRSRDLPRSARVSRTRSTTLRGRRAISDIACSITGTLMCSDAAARAGSAGRRGCSARRHPGRGRTA